MKKKNIKMEKTNLDMARIQKVVALARALIQPGDDGAILIGHKMLRNTLMLEIRDLDDKLKILGHVSPIKQPHPAPGGSNPAHITGQNGARQ